MTTPLKQARDEMPDELWMMRNADGDLVRCCKGFHRGERYTRAIEQEAAQGIEGDYHRVMSLLQSTKMEHGLCKPRERRACTACNACDDLDKMIDEYKGPKVVASEAHAQGQKGSE